MNIINKIITKYINYRIKSIISKNNSLIFDSIIFTPNIKSDKILSVQKLLNNFSTINNSISLMFYSKNLKAKEPKYPAGCKEPCKDCDGCDTFLNTIIKL